MQRRTAFTLVELLVVISIIALLISILLPTLGKARGAATRANCLSNQRQLASALHLYATENRGYFPPQYIGMESNVTMWGFYAGWDVSSPIGDPAAERRGANHGYVGLGYLIVGKVIKDGKAFYCPDQPFDQFKYERWASMWNRMRAGERFTADSDRLQFGYLYRIHRSTSVIAHLLEPGELERLNALRLGKFKRMMSLVSDIPFFYNVNNWAHVKPYGLCVAYADGHGEFHQVDKKDYDVVVDLTISQTRTDREAYAHYMWFAIDRNDYRSFSEFAEARDWEGAMNRYGHY